MECIALALATFKWGATNAVSSDFGCSSIVDLDQKDSHKPMDAIAKCIVFYVHLSMG